MAAAGDGRGSTCSTRSLVISSLVLSLLSAAVSLAVAAVFVSLYSPAQSSQEDSLTARVSNLELRLRAGREMSLVCQLPPDPGPCTSSVR